MGAVGGAGGALSDVGLLVGLGIFSSAKRADRFSLIGPVDAKVSGVEVLAVIKERKPEVPLVTAHGFGRGRGGY